MSDYGERQAKLLNEFQDADEFPSGLNGWQMFLIERIAELEAASANHVLEMEKLADENRKLQDISSQHAAYLYQRIEDLRDLLKTSHENNKALREQVEILKHGMKGDYDLDAWLDWVCEAKALREQVRWVPVSERLPSDNGMFVCTCKSGHVSIFGFNYLRGVFNWAGSAVTHWMPLPPPPHEG